MSIPPSDCHRDPVSAQSAPRPRNAAGEAVDPRSDGRRKYPNSTLLASSADRGWSTLFAELRSHPAGQITSAVQQSVEFIVTVLGSASGLVIRSGAGLH